MSSLKHFQGHTGREHTVHDINTYRGIPMFCDERLHEVCFSHITHLPRGSRVLILGSGSGAFDQRLVDHGFTNVTSLDFRPDFFRAQGTAFIERDLNKDFSDLGTYDLIMAIELIEHLENPAHFLRNAAECLAANGTLLVTTPNIESGPSRISFLVQEKLSFFTEADMHGSGHISPLPHHIFAFHTKNAGLHISTHAYNRNAWEARFSSNIREMINSLTQPIHALAVLAKTAMLILLSPLTLLKRSNGNIHIYVLQKA